MSGAALQSVHIKDRLPERSPAKTALRSDDIDRMRTCEGGGLYLRADDRSSSNWTALSSGQCHAYRRIWPVADGPSCIFTGVATPVWKRACFMAEAAKRNIRLIATNHPGARGSMLCPVVRPPPIRTI